MTLVDLTSILTRHADWLAGRSAGIRANLHAAVLCGANLDLACLPLGCGGLRITIDRRLGAQIAYHLCSTTIADMPADIAAARAALLPIANEMHRTDVPRLE